MINIGARLLQNMEILHRTWDNLVSDLLPYQNRLHEEYAGMYSDIEMKLSDFNTHVINTIQTMAEQKTGEDE
jgi:L-ribulose-5-phosphate 3-epimerase UlaE